MLVQKITSKQGTTGIIGSAFLSSLLVLFLLAPHMTLPVHAGTHQHSNRYLSPSEMVFGPGGKALYVLCEQSDEILVLDAATQQVENHIPVGHIPRALVVSPNGHRLYVTNSWDDTISEIDLNTQKVVRTISAGREPYGMVIDRSGKTLYIANRIGNDVSVVDIATGKEKKRLPAGHGASYLAISHDGRFIYCTHVYPEIGPDRTPSQLSMPWIGSIHVNYSQREDRQPPQSAITVIDTATEAVVRTIPQPSVAGVFHVTLSDDGRLGIAAQMQPKNLVPLAHVEHGWGIGYSLTLFGTDVGTPVQVPLDELERYDSYPYAVAITPDKTRIFVTATGSDSVTVIDTKRLLAFVHGHAKPFINDLSASANYVIARISVGKNPRGITLSPDGRELYIANRMDDSLSVIDTGSNRVVRTVKLSGPETVTALRHGEQLFFSSRYAFQGQFSCANCHIDSTMDGLSWDLEPDGLGRNIVETRLMEDLPGTEPFKWNGSNPSLAVECGPRTALYIYRSHSFSSPELADLVLYIRSLPPRPNRFRLPNGQLTPEQARGKEFFYRTVNKAGMSIPRENQCSFCHSGPKFTSQKSFDVGTGRPSDTSAVFDTPHLINDALVAPYLHDGSARTLEEIWTLFNMDNKHGQTTDMTKDELHDLVEYLKTL